jgi:thioredoxin 1
MGERILLLLALGLLLAVAALAWRRYQAHQAGRLSLADLPNELLGLSLGQGPAVLYFTTDTCAQCRFQQAPALARVQARRPDLQLVQLDAIDHRALADYYHVMTVPTTVVLNAYRRPVAINHGLAGDDRLMAQLNHAAPCDGREQ